MDTALVLEYLADPLVRATDQDTDVAQGKIFGTKHLHFVAAGVDHSSGRLVGGGSRRLERLNR